MKYYVHQPAKNTGPRSQRHTEFNYGPFNTREEAEKWKHEKGLDIYQSVTIIEIDPERNKRP